MTRTFTVNLTTGADTVIRVELSDDDLRQVADNLNVADVADLTLDDLRELVEERAHDRIPSICAQCSGWADNNVSLSLGDDWTLADEMQYVDTAWVGPAVRAFIERVLPAQALTLPAQLTQELRDAAVAHAAREAARYPAVEETTESSKS